MDVKEKIVDHFTVEQQPSSDYIILTMDLSQYDKDSSAQAALELVHAYGIALAVIFIIGAVTANPALLLIALGGASVTFFLGAPIASELDENTDKYYLSKVVGNRYDQAFPRARVKALPKNIPSVFHVDTSTLEVDNKPSEPPASTNTVEPNSNESEDSLPKPRL